MATNTEGTGKPILQVHMHNISATTATMIDWSTEGGVQQIYISGTSSGSNAQGVYVGFDVVANTDSFYVPLNVASSTVGMVMFDLHGLSVKRISLLATNATNDITVMGVKN